MTTLLSLASAADVTGIAWGIPLVVLIVVGSLVWHFSRSRSLLEQWATANGFQILDSEYRSFRRGPFFWTTSKSQTVYYVKVRDREGRTHSGWVRCGSWFLGLWSDRTEVRWDDGV